MVASVTVLLRCRFRLVVSRINLSAGAGHPHAHLRKALDQGCGCSGAGHACRAVHRDGCALSGADRVGQGDRPPSTLSLRPSLAPGFQNSAPLGMVAWISVFPATKETVRLRSDRKSSASVALRCPCWSERGRLGVSRPADGEQGHQSKDCQDQPGQPTSHRRTP